MDIYTKTALFPLEWQCVSDETVYGIYINDIKYDK